MARKPTPIHIPVDWQGKKRQQKIEDGCWICPHCKLPYKAKSVHISKEHMMGVKEFEKYCEGLDK